MLEQVLNEKIKEYLESCSYIKSHDDISDSSEIDRIYWQGTLLSDILEDVNKKESLEYKEINKIINIVMYNM